MARKRRTKCDPESIERFGRAIRLGAKIEDACKFAGFSYRRFREWIVDAESSGEKSPYYPLLKEFTTAKGDGVAMLLGRIQKAAQNGSWQAAAWVLAVSYTHLTLPTTPYV